MSVRSARSRCVACCCSREGVLVLRSSLQLILLSCHDPYHAFLGFVQHDLWFRPRVMLQKRRSTKSMSQFISAKVWHRVCLCLRVCVCVCVCLICVGLVSPSSRVCVWWCIATSLQPKQPSSEQLVSKPAEAGALSGVYSSRLSLKPSKIQELCKIALGECAWGVVTVWVGVSPCCCCCCCFFFLFFLLLCCCALDAPLLVDHLTHTDA
jgi:hypothetical protein